MVAVLPPAAVIARAPLMLGRYTARAYHSMNERDSQSASPILSRAAAAGSMVPAVGRTCLDRSWHCLLALSR